MFPVRIELRIAFPLRVPVYSRHRAALFPFAGARGVGERKKVLSWRARHLLDGSCIIHGSDYDEEWQESRLLEISTRHRLAPGK